MFDIVCAGHICLDITPVLPAGTAGIQQVFVPGKLTESGELVMSTGGSVANTGIALIKLGISTALVGKIGDDISGGITRRILEHNGGSGQYLSVAKNEATSYSIVLAPPGFDRTFIHNPAVNNTFGMEDIDYELVRQSKVFHIGYPTVMRRLSQNHGEELTRILQKAKQLGAATSIDTAYPDMDSENGRQDWQRVFENVLPWTDIFMPSIEEAMLMFDYSEFARLKAMDEDVLKNLDVDYLPRLGKRLADMGAGIVVIKCGTRGYYVRTQGAEALGKMGRGVPADVKEWADREIFSSIYHVDDVKSTTGAGDTSIAGFLAALVTGRSVTEAVDIACATGAACVTELSATGGIVSLNEIIAKSKVWRKRPCEYTGRYFVYDERHNVLAQNKEVMVYPGERGF